MSICPAFPVSLVPHGRRRGGGATFFRLVYLGSHPVAVLFALAITLYLWAIVAAWLLLVTVCWLLACAVVVPVRLLSGRTARPAG